MSEIYSGTYESGPGPTTRLMPENMRRIAGAVTFVVVIGVMGLWAYDLGTRDAAEVPIVRAIDGPFRIQPSEPGGLTASHQGLEVNSVLAGVSAPSVSAITPIEVPVILLDEDDPLGELSVATRDALAIAEDLRMPMAEDGPSDLNLTTEEKAAVGISLEDAIAAAIAAEAAGAAAPSVLASTRPLRRPANLVRARAISSSPTTNALPSAAIAREVSSVAPGARLVQLGAYDNEALTRRAWTQLVAQHGDLLGDKSLYVQRTTANARVFYRLRVAGFDSTTEASSLCEALRVRGVDCIPVTIQ